MATNTRQSASRKRRKKRRQMMRRRIIFFACVAGVIVLVILLIHGISGKSNTVQPVPVETQAVQPQSDSAMPEEEPSPLPGQVQSYDVLSNGKYAYGELPETAPVEYSYFDDAVFVGDSVMQGFRYDVKYRRETKDKGYFGEAQFLTAQSYAVYHAISSSADTQHPSYRGKVQPVEISIRDMGAKKVYIMLGMNDIFLMGVMKTLTNYETLIGRIRGEAPDVEIYILSVIPCTRNAIKKNSKMDVGAYTFFNQRLPKFTAEHECYYVDVAKDYLDEDGYLKSEYSSDDYVHIQSGCFDFWADALRTHTSVPH